MFTEEQITGMATMALVFQKKANNKIRNKIMNDTQRKNLDAALAVLALQKSAESRDDTGAGNGTGVLVPGSIPSRKALASQAGLPTAGADSAARLASEIEEGARRQRLAELGQYAGAGAAGAGLGAAMGTGIGAILGGGKGAGQGAGIGAIAGLPTGLIALYLAKRMNQKGSQKQASDQGITNSYLNGYMIGYDAGASYVPQGY